MARRKQLPEEMIEEVALRLPPKSVGRFRCASKAWRSRLSNPTFLRAHFDFHSHDAGPVSIIFEHDHYHYKRHSSNHHGHLLTCAADGSVGKLVTSPFFGRGQFGQLTAEASIHGFVVVGIEADKENSLFLFNPITSEALKLPRFQSSNPYECMHFIGLGYDRTNHDYKIVRLSYSEHHYKRKHDGTFVDIYSFKMKSWRKLRKSPYDHAVTDLPCPGVFVNDCLHWLARDDKASKAYVIAAFNLAKEEFEEVPSPPTDSYDSCQVVEGNDDSCEIVQDSDDSSEEYSFDDSYEGLDDSSQVIALGGCLAVVCPVYNEFLINVWVMRKYGVQESWNKLMIDTDMRYIENFVCSLSEDEVVFRQCGMGKKQLAAYSLSTKVWRDIAVDATDCIEEHIGVVAYTECLLSPNHILE